MGYYINSNSKGEVLSPNGKVNALVADGAVVQQTPKYIPQHSVCVIENGFFDAAAYLFNENEFNEFLHDNSGRRKTFLVYAHAQELAK